MVRSGSFPVEYNKQNIENKQLGPFRFKMQCSNDAMINAFIPPGARVIVDQNLTPKNGDIVVAFMEGKYTIKFLKKNDVRSWLVPANRKYQDIEITDAENIMIIGVVSSITIDPSLLRNYMI